MNLGFTSLAADIAALCDRHEQWPIDSELAGFVPIDEVREILEAHG